METTAVTFDTHKAVKTLKNAGLEYSQAEAVVETINKAVNETVATKADLQVLSATLDATNETVGDLKENMATLATKEALDNNSRALDDLKTTVGDLKESMATMATKEGLANNDRALGDLKTTTATKEGLDNNNKALDDLKATMATKEALANTNKALEDLKETVAEIKATMATKEYVKTEIAKAIKHIYIISLTQTVILVTLVVTLSKLL